VRIFFIYPNNTGNQKVPLGCVYLNTILRQLGHTVEFFDMTFFGIDIEKHDINIRGRLLNFRELDLAPWGVVHEHVSQEDAFTRLRQRALDFQPDVVAITLTEDTSLFGFECINEVHSVLPDAYFLAGGVFCMTEPMFVLSQPAIDAVCPGEAENCLPELLRRMEADEPYIDVDGFWFKTEDGTIIRREVAPPTDLNAIPFPDLTGIDDRHFYSPMGGNVYKMTFVEGQRGCPRRCTYCCNQLFLDAYKHYKGRYLRKKTIERLIGELEYLKQTYDFTFFQFTDDDFTLRSVEELQLFKKLYLERVNVPFWCQAEANNITDQKIKLMREAGCVSISVGIETGSQRILTEVYKRRTSQEATVRAFRIMHKYGIRTSGNIIIGVPQEERSDIMSTVHLARRCHPKSLNVNVFAPYRGTELRKISVEKGYLDPNFIRDGRKSWMPVLEMPQISKEEIMGLVRTFALYSILPLDIFPLIRECEIQAPESKLLFDSLERLFWEITELQGIDFYIPGYDYEAAFLKRRRELEARAQA